MCNRMISIIGLLIRKLVFMDNGAQYQKIFQDTFEKIKLENDKLQKMTILISGKSGVGKSTLINTVFGAELSKTGVGKPITDKISLISQENFPVNIYDTIGLELKAVKFDLLAIAKSISKNDIQKLINKVQHTETSEDDIHVVWYAISGNSSRIEDPEIDLINWILAQKIPVIIVLTKTFDITESDKLKKEIFKIIPAITDVVTTLAIDSEIKASFGIEELINKTFEVLPEGINTAFVHSQAASINLKKREALKVVNTNMAANFGIGFSPIPGSDAPLMISSQTAMIAKITSIFGVDVTKNQVETVILSLLGVYGALFAGKSLAGNLLKVIPGLGTVGGGLISGGVGMIITGALGRAYIELMILVSSGRVDLSSMTSDEIRDLLISLLEQYLPK